MEAYFQIDKNPQKRFSALKDRSQLTEIDFKNAAKSLFENVQIF